MARPGQLADAIAEVFDQDVATVRHQARMLRNAGYMSLERAGRGAGSMTPRDGANLLISVAGSSRVKYSTRPVEQHGACKSKEGAWAFLFEGPSELLALGPNHTFADTIEALLRAAIGTEQADLSIEVNMQDPLPMSEVRIGLHRWDSDGAPLVMDLVSRHYETQVSNGRFDPPINAFANSDLTHTHSFTEKAFYKVAEVFR